MWGTQSNRRASLFGNSRCAPNFGLLGFVGFPARKLDVPLETKLPPRHRNVCGTEMCFKWLGPQPLVTLAKDWGVVKQCELGICIELMPNRTGTAGVVRSCLMAVYRRDLSEAMRFRRRPNYIHLAWTCQAGRGHQQERKEGWHSGALDQCQQIPNAAVAMTPAVYLHRVWPRCTQLSLWNLKPTETHQAPHLCQATPCSEGKACRYPRPLLPAPQCPSIPSTWP